MIRFVGRRVLQAVLTLVGVSVLTFFLVRATGDPSAILLPPDSPPEVVHQFRAEYGLDKPLPVQYLLFLEAVFRGSLGTSIRYREPVTALLGERLMATLELAGAAVLIAGVLGFSLGAIGALRRNRGIDVAGRTFALFGQAVPSFYLGIVLTFLFGIVLHWLPTYGNEGFASLILPAVTLSMYLLPLVLRVTRGGFLDVMGREYIRTARAKGMPEPRVVGVHMTKNAAVPVVTVLGLQLGAALSGAVVTETVFSWPGVGQLLVNSVSTRDFPVVEAITLYAAAAFIVVNLLVDILYTVLDPRVRVVS